MWWRATQRKHQPHRGVQIRQPGYKSENLLILLRSLHLRYLWLCNGRRRCRCRLQAVGQTVGSHHHSEDAIPMARGRFPLHPQKTDGCVRPTLKRRTSASAPPSKDGRLRPLHPQKTDVCVRSILKRRTSASAASLLIHIIFKRRSHQFAFKRRSHHPGACSVTLGHG